MIHEVTGDILVTNAQAIAHGVTPNDHFDNGLALALREQWSAMAKDFATMLINRTQNRASFGYGPALVEFALSIC